MIFSRVKGSSEGRSKPSSISLSLPCSVTGNSHVPTFSLICCSSAQQGLLHDPTQISLHLMRLWPWAAKNPFLLPSCPIFSNTAFCPGPNSTKYFLFQTPTSLKQENTHVRTGANYQITSTIASEINRKSVISDTFCSHLPYLILPFKA